MGTAHRRVRANCVATEPVVEVLQPRELARLRDVRALADLPWFGSPEGRRLGGRGMGRGAILRRLLDVGGDRLAERLDAGRRRVAVVAVSERLDRRLDDMIGGAEIRLADAEIDDVAALRRKVGGAGEHGEGVLLADPVEAGNRGLSGFPCKGRGGVKISQECGNGVEPSNCRRRHDATVFYIALPVNVANDPTLSELPPARQNDIGSVRNEFGEQECPAPSRRAVSRRI